MFHNSRSPNVELKNPTREFIDNLVHIDWSRIYEFVLETHYDNVDWDVISTIQPMDERFVEIFQDNINWIIVSYKTDLSITFLNKFKWVLHWDILTINYPLSSEFARTFENHLIWDVIVGNPHITEVFLIEFMDMWDDEHWDDISEYLNLSEPFIQLFHDTVNWEHISTEQTLSCDFMREFSHKIHWPLIAYYQTLDKQFFIDFKERIDWVTMSIGGKTKIDFTLTELLDIHDTIYTSIERFLQSGKKHPLHCQNCSKPVPKHKLKPIKDITRRISLLHLSASHIQFKWKESISNPAHKLCRTVLLRDFESMTNQLMSLNK